MVGRITPRDMEALADAGFVKEGRHWVYAWNLVEGVDVEVPDAPQVYPPVRPNRDGLSWVVGQFERFLQAPALD